MLVLLGSGVRLLLSFLSATTKSQHSMKSGLLLNVVVRQSTSIFQLLASKDQSLLVRRNSFFILDLGLYIFYCIQGLDLESDGLPRQGLHENLHLGGSTADGGSEKGFFFKLKASMLEDNFLNKSLPVCLTPSLLLTCKPARFSKPPSWCPLLFCCSSQVCRS